MRKLILICSIVLLIATSFSQVEQTQATVTSGLLINEVLPDPAGNDALYEWIEIYNAGTGSLNLSDFKIGSTTLPAGTISSGEYLILAKDVINFQAKYNLSIRVLAYSMSLSNSGGSLLLKDINGNEIQNFSYGQSSEEKSFELLKGNCGTIQLNSLGSTVGQMNTSCPNLTTPTTTIITTVTPSPTTFVTNTPSPTPTTTPTATSVNYSNLIIISKIYPNPDSGDEWIELTNLDNVDLNLQNWQLRDKSNNKFTLGSIILATTQSTRVFPSTVSLNNDGDILSLFDPAGNQIDIFNYPTSSKGETFSLSDTSSVSEITPSVTPTAIITNQPRQINLNEGRVRYAIPRIYQLI